MIVLEPYDLPDHGCKQPGSLVSEVVSWECGKYLNSPEQIFDKAGIFTG